MPKVPELNDIREKCYECYRPKKSCMCEYIQRIETNTRFVIIMHPKEFKKTKNNTGRFTHIFLLTAKILFEHGHVESMIKMTFLFLSLWIV